MIDEQAAEVLRLELRRLLGDRVTQRIELDAQELRIVSPRGLGVLAGVARATRLRGGPIAVVNCRPRLLGTFRVARIPAAVGELADGDMSAEPDLDVDWTPWWSSAAANA